MEKEQARPERTDTNEEARLHSIGRDNSIYSMGMTQTASYERAFMRRRNSVSMASINTNRGELQYED